MSKVYVYKFHIKCNWKMLDISKMMEMFDMPAIYINREIEMTQESPMELSVTQVDKLMSVTKKAFEEQGHKNVQVSFVGMKEDANEKES